MAFRPVIPSASTATAVVVVPAGSATMVVVPSRPAAVPSGSTRSAEVVVAAAPVPVVAPPWIPELPRAPLWERTRLGLSVSRGAHTGESQTGGERGCRRGHTYFFVHRVRVPSALVAKQPAVQPFSICDIAEPTHSALARTRKGNGRGITATVTSSNLGLRSVTSTG